MKFKTRCAEIDLAPPVGSRPAAPPIFASATFGFEDLAALEGYFRGEGGHLYSRYENPTVGAAERKLAALEGAEEAVMFASGMAAISAVFLSLASRGDAVGVQRGTYGGTVVLARDWLSRFGIEVREFPLEGLADPSPADFEGLRLLWVESPVNPTLESVPLAKIARAASSAGVPVAADATFGTPALQRPIELGVTYAVHSCTKYLGGHSDLIGGAVVGSREALAPLHDARKILGGCMDPWTAFLLHRGMRTLAVRMEAHVAHARAVAEALRDHPRVRRVRWPGFEEASWAREQLRGGGAMVTFEVDGGDATAERVHDALRRFLKGGSLGGVESLVSLPRTTSHRGMTEDERAARGISPGLIRLSVGLEDPGDLIADLARALDRA